MRYAYSDEQPAKIVSEIGKPYRPGTDEDGNQNSLQSRIHAKQFPDKRASTIRTADGLSPAQPIISEEQIDGYRFAPPILRASSSAPLPQNFRLIGHAAAQGPSGALPDGQREGVEQPGGAGG